jgi:hypothetical protein
MKRIKTHEATGVTLDYLVSKASNPPGQCGWGWWERDDEGFLFDPLNECRYSPSTDWNQGHFLLEWVDTFERENGVSTAHKKGPDGQQYKGVGPSALIAVCRCFVASKLGEKVEIPNDLLTK